MNLQRFLKPESIAIFGGSWAANVIEQLLKSGYQGQIWPVHPKRDSILGVACYANISDLPSSPDAAFIGVNRETTIEVVAELSQQGCGGAICFASGFRESQINKNQTQDDLQAQLITAAGDMPILGPNCYGYLNYLDNICLWPDQHGGTAVSEGVAIIAQSSNIAINMTMQRRGLGLTHMLTVGNQAQVGVSDLAMSVLSDSRVKAVGFYLESFGDLASFESMANQARTLNKPLVILKVGKSIKAQLASLTHTASLAGSAAASSAFLERLGLVEVDSIAVLLETLKLLHTVGPLSSENIASMSCSGGEASLMSDMALGTSIVYPDLTEGQQTELASILGDKVDLANPLDYHTYVWGDVPTMTACYEAVLKGKYGLSVLVLDVPRSDLCDPAGHDCALAAIIEAKRNTNANAAVLSVLPECLDEAVSKRLLDAGVVPLHGMSNGLAAIDAAIRSGKLLNVAAEKEPVIVIDMEKRHDTSDYCLNEAQAKSALSEAGLVCPKSHVCQQKTQGLASASQLSYPLVLKGLGVAHKTEANAVVLNIKSDDELSKALNQLAECPDGYLIEEMVDDVVAELLIGVTVDSSGFMLLTIGAGGVLAELMSDTASLCMPTSRKQIQQVVSSLKIASLLNGYRDKPAADEEAMLDAIEAVTRYASAQAGSLIELDINPLMVGTQTSVAADALIRLIGDKHD